MSLLTAVSTNKRTLTVEIFKSNSNIGSIKGSASIDIKVACPEPEEDIIDMNVKTTEIPAIPKRDPVMNSCKSLTGNPEKKDIIKVITTNKLTKNTKL